MGWALGQIALGLVALAAGGEVMLRGAVGLARLMRLSPAVIGLTVVAAGTSVPELAVSLVAAGDGRTDLVVGNVVGSNIFNLTVVVGLASLIRPATIGGTTISLEYPVLLLVTLGFAALADHNTITRFDGIFLVACYVAFTAYAVSLVRGQLSAAERQELTAETQSRTPIGRRPWLVSLALIIAGAALLALGADRTVAGAVTIGQALGMSDRVIGLTIVGIGTGLPEIVTSAMASFRGHSDVAVGNVVGSNLFNMLVILGLTAAVRPLPVDPAILASDRWWMLAVTALVYPVLIRGRRVDRWESLMLLVAYGAYLTLLLRSP